MTFCHYTFRSFYLFLLKIGKEAYLETVSYLQLPPTVFLVQFITIS